ncbi:hypothetical protein [Mycolicibacterium elephantis]|uniref:Ryanodine receptor Ryr domain-containing protein n=1 Tax=Mycolicibacterium elephantis TaxID=81858 RepID=A0A1X0CYQ0_9MYCO|nr:hypothetical protein [Mycolicibacterium elephantis]OBE99139.1 hypothetical protein A5776_11350 [Mycolicibacterium elephantis]ORA65294.1 hypothetical protein BST23_14510 [Mycolicibacterium elephantis]
MRSTVAVAAVRAVSVVASLVLGYLVALALAPQLRDRAPSSLQWFGRPGSWQSIAIVVTVLALLGVLVVRAQGVRRPGAPVAIVAGLALISAALGLVSYWDCHDDEHPWFFRPLMFTASVVKGGTGDQSLGGQTCPSPTPVALEIARLSALAAIFLSVIGVAAALFRSRMDRLRVYFARSVTAVVDVDDDTLSMVSAIARTMDPRSTLVLITTSLDHPCVPEARNHGARVVAVDFDRPETLKTLSLWRKLDRLYLLSADPSSNLLRLKVIADRLAEVSRKQRLPLIVRIDDPWQAEAWRAMHFGGSDTRWAADAVGKYEVTARRLLDRIISTDRVDRILVCGTSRLTLALCSNMAQRQLERDYYAAPDEDPLPRLVLVAENAEEYEQDYAMSRRRLGLSASSMQVQTVAERPSVPVLASLLADASDTAVILVDRDTSAASSIDTTTGTRLAARFPTAPIYAWDATAQVTEDRLSLVGKLRTYRLSMDLPEGQAQDAWERAARLIHDRYAAEAGHRSAGTRPWAELDEFYRESNRRQVRNALWMVEQIGGHTWNAWNATADDVDTPNLRGLPPLDQLRLLGFERDEAIAMARAEHEDWCRYYRASGWRYGPQRDDARKIHDKLVDWAGIEADPDLLNAALGSLAATLSKLRELGYRSRPARERPEWQRFRRIGDVIAEQRDTAWTWKTGSGETMRAEAGDWAVRDVDGDERWSVRDDIFRATYQHEEGDRWQRRGTVRARPAEDGETVATLEGSVRASSGDWVVQGDQGEQWVVPGEQFARRYDGPVTESRVTVDSPDQQTLVSE